jgi:hypothetical protein
VRTPSPAPIRVIERDGFSTGDIALDEKPVCVEETMLSGVIHTNLLALFADSTCRQRLPTTNFQRMNEFWCLLLQICALSVAVLITDAYPEFTTRTEHESPRSQA